MTGLAHLFDLLVVLNSSTKPIFFPPHYISLSKQYFHLCLACCEFLKLNAAQEWESWPMAVLDHPEHTQGAKAHVLYTVLYCCNLSGGVALIMWFTTNGMCVKNKTIIHVARGSNSKRDFEHDLIVTCCHSAKLCAHAAWDFRLQQYTSMWKYNFEFGFISVNLQLKFN